MTFRKEKDSIGYIDVPADKYWGAQTQRSIENFKGAAYYWDNTGINRLDDTVPGFTTLNSTALKISPNGNYIAGEILLLDAQSNFISTPVIWEGANRTLRVLRDNNANIVNGIVSDVSDAGHVVGSFFDASIAGSAQQSIIRLNFGNNLTLLQFSILILKFVILYFLSLF